jgi:WD40 repeat protein
MKLTAENKRLIPAVVLAVLFLVFLEFRSYLPDWNRDPPPETGEIRDISSSLIDRALSAYYEWKTDEPIVAIIRQDIDAQIGAISPDGQYIATGGSVIRDVAISSVAEKRIARKLAVDSGSVNAVAFSPDGRYLASGRGFMVNRKHNESVHIWDMQHGKLIKKLPGPAGPERIENEATALAFSPDSSIIAVSYHPQPNSGDSIHLFDVTTGDRIRVMHPSSYVQRYLIFFEGGKYLGYESDGFHVFEVATGKQVQEFNLKAAFALSPDGRYLAAGMDETKDLRIIDRQTGREVKVLGSVKGYYRFLAFSPDGRHLAVHSDDGLALWDVWAGKRLRELKGHPDIVSHWIGFDAEGRYFAAVCERYVVVWDFRKLVEAGHAN